MPKNIKNILIFISLSFSPNLWAKKELPEALKAVGVDERLGKRVPIGDLQFKNENGSTVTLANYVKGEKPIVIMMGYYKCPKLCSLILNGLISAAKSQTWSLGKEFDLVMVSIDAREDPVLASSKKQSYVKYYGRVDGEKGIHFLTGEQENITKLAKSLGINFKYDKRMDQYVHPAVLAVISPKGKITRYLYGIDFKSSDLKLALIEGANGTVGTIIDRILLFCYSYDPEIGSYSFTITRILKVLSTITLLIVGVFILGFWRRQNKEAKKTALAQQ